MKKLFLVFILLLFACPAPAIKLQPGIVMRAQQEAFRDVQPQINTAPYQLYATNAPQGYRTDYSDGRYSIHAGKKMYGYKNGKLVLVAISDKDALEFPRKTYQYEYPSGKLLNVSYATSPKDGYIYNPDGSLVGIWEDDVFYKGEQEVLSAKTTILN